MKDERVIYLSATELGQVIYESLTLRGVLKEPYDRLLVVLMENGSYKCTFFNETQLPPKDETKSKSSENKPARMIRVDE